jgi:hypothetical protein
METHRTAQRQAIKQNMRSIVLKDAIFPNGFFHFMDTLATNEVISEDWTVNPGAIGYRWNTRTSDLTDVLVETQKFPTDSSTGVLGDVGIVIFEGRRTALDIVESVLISQNVCYKEMIKGCSTTTPHK